MFYEKVLVLTTLLSLSAASMANFEGSAAQQGGFSGEGAKQLRLPLHKHSKHGTMHR
ncbi:Uncharacterised protein [Actinobacillus equuli]|nr:Uncharacterised protein [Actinobacillus equuli]